MCGIVGYYSNGKPKFSKDTLNNYIKELFPTLMAKGGAINNTDGSGIFFPPIGIIKTNTMATSFIKTKEFAKVLSNRQIPKVCILHVRKATKGSVNCLANAQPIFSNNYVMVHNGSVDSDIEDEELITAGLPKEMDVDSAKIAALFEKYEDKTEVLKHLGGKAAFVVYDKSQHEIYFYRDNKPMFLALAGNVIWFSSTSESLYSLLSTKEDFLGLKEENVIFNNVAVYELPHFKMFKISIVNGKFKGEMLSNQTLTTVTFFENKKKEKEKQAGALKTEVIKTEVVEQPAEQLEIKLLVENTDLDLTKKINEQAIKENEKEVAERIDNIKEKMNKIEDKFIKESNQTSQNQNNNTEKEEKQLRQIKQKTINIVETLKIDLPNLDVFYSELINSVIESDITKPFTPEFGNRGFLCSQCGSFMEPQIELKNYWISDNNDRECSCCREKILLKEPYYIHQGKFNNYFMIINYTKSKFSYPKKELINIASYISKHLKSKIQLFVDIMINSDLFTYNLKLFFKEGIIYMVPSFNDMKMIDYGKTTYLYYSLQENQRTTIFRDITKKFFFENKILNFDNILFYLVSIKPTDSQGFYLPFSVSEIDINNKTLVIAFFILEVIKEYSILMDKNYCANPNKLN